MTATKIKPIQFNGMTGAYFGLGTAAPSSLLSVLSANPGFGDNYAGISLMSGATDNWTSFVLGRVNPDITIGVGTATAYLSDSSTGDVSIIHGGTIRIGGTLSSTSDISLRQNGLVSIGAALSSVFCSVNNTVNTAYTAFEVMGASTNNGPYFALSSSTGSTRGDVLCVLSGGNVGIGIQSGYAHLHIQSFVGSAGSPGTEIEMILNRPITQNISYQQSVGFAVGTYATNSISNGYGPKTRFDILLKSAASSSTIPDTTVLTLLDNGKMGLGVTRPSYNLSFNPEVVSIGVERSSVSDCNGNDLMLYGGGATVGATNRDGGSVRIAPGMSTGTGSAGVALYGNSAGVSGTDDNGYTTVVEIIEDAIGFHGVTPVYRQLMATGTGKTVDNIITALQTLGLFRQN